ncbi:MAG: hypothetical protein M3R57_00355 [Chloroflexota bacterium]|nr:hypothetical protein [Chloroflexota bacterium]
MSRLSLVFAALLLLAGCGSTPTPSPSASPSFEPSGAPPLDPAVLGLTCGGTNAFHPALLEVPGHAESDPDAAAAALRVEITGSASELGLPGTGWVRVTQLADRVQFVAPDGDGAGWFVVGLTLRDGRWTLDVMGECQPEVVLPPGVARAEWRLDPAFPAPAGGDRQIHALITEQACANGKPPEGRVLPPLVTPSQTAVTIAILVTNIPGGADCPGNPEFALTVDLPEPLGGRTLLDGAVYPPRDIRQPAP